MWTFCMMIHKVQKTWTELNAMKQYNAFHLEHLTKEIDCKWNIFLRKLTDDE